MIFFLTQGLKNTFTWGRASRMEYLGLHIVFLLFSIIIALCESFISEMDLWPETIIIIVGIISIFLIISLFTVIARRLHDINRSAWLMIILCIPILNIILELMLFFKKSTSEDISLYSHSSDEVNSNEGEYIQDLESPRTESFLDKSFAIFHKIGPQRIVAAIMIILLYVSFCSPVKLKDIYEYPLDKAYYLHDFSYPNLNSRASNFTSNDMKGKYSMLTYSATWCKYCVNDHPEIVEVSKEVNMNFYAIAVQDNPNKLKKMLEKKGNPYTKIGLCSKDCLKELPVAGIPVNLLYNPQGKLIYAGRGITLDFLKQKISYDISIRNNNQ